MGALNLLPLRQLELAEHTQMARAKQALYQVLIASVVSDAKEEVEHSQ